jgi:hypothetical protein
LYNAHLLWQTLVAMSLKDTTFDEKITLRDAYRIMEQLIMDVNERSPTDTEWLHHMYLRICENGEISDPAAEEDFLNARNTVLNKK